MEVFPPLSDFQPRPVLFTTETGILVQSQLFLLLGYSKQLKYIKSEVFMHSKRIAPNGGQAGELFVAFREDRVGALIFSNPFALLNLSENWTYLS